MMHSEHQSNMARLSNPGALYVRKELSKLLSKGLSKCNYDKTVRLYKVIMYWVGWNEGLSISESTHGGYRLLDRDPLSMLASFNNQIRPLTPPKAQHVSLHPTPSYYCKTCWFLLHTSSLPACKEILLSPNVPAYRATLIYLISL